MTLRSNVFLGRSWLVYSIASLLTLTGHSALASQTTADASYEMPSTDVTVDHTVAKNSTKHKASHANRKVANEDGMTITQGESMMSPGLKSLRDDLLGIRSPINLDALLAQYDAEMVSLEKKLNGGDHDGFLADAKKIGMDRVFFEAQLVNLRSMRSIVWKSIPLFKKYNMVHSAALSHVRAVAKNLAIFFPDSNWDAGFKYVSEPFNAEEQSFPDDTAFFNFLGKTVYATLLRTYNIVNALNIDGAVWDSQILYGRIDTFSDGQYRFKTLSEADRYMVLSQISAAMANAKQVSAYSNRGFFETATQVGRVFGLDGFLSSDVEGATDESVVQAMNTAKKKFPNFLKLHTIETDKVDGPKLMAQAYDLWRISLIHLRNAWGEVKSGRADANRLINPNVFVGYAPYIDNSLNNLDAMLTGNSPVRSHATGETVTVNLRTFYTKPPADLFALLPNSFDQAKTRCPSYTKAGGCSSKQEVRNYKWGSATAWNLEAHRSYLPELGNDSKDIKRLRRIASESTTFWFGAIPATALPAL